MATFDYMARALQSGLFINSAHIDAFSVNGSDIASAEANAGIHHGQRVRV